MMDSAKGLFLFCCLMLSLCGCHSDTPEAYRESGERLNNLVQRMAVVEKSYQKNGAAEFVNPRHGFIWVKTQKEGTFTVKAKTGALSQTFTTWECEGYVRLPAGRYTLSGDWGDRLQIHSVPTLIFSYFLGKPAAEEPWHYFDDGRIGVFEYNFPWLKKNVLPSFNVMAHNDTRGIPPELQEQWQAAGRKFYCQIGEQNVDHWEEWMLKDKYDGLQIDEFVTPRGKITDRDKALNYTQPGLGFDQKTLGELKRIADKHPDFAITPWLGMNWDAHSEDNLPLWQAITNSKFGGVMYEAYMRSRDFDYEFEKITKRIAPFQAFGTHALDHVYCGFGLFMLLDDNASVDFKVFLDRVMQKLSNEPDFFDLGGLGLWASYYAEPEHLKWYARLLRHYAIEGNKELLSDKFNYKFKPEIVKSPMWETLDDWNAQPAENDSLQLVNAQDTEKTGVTYGYWPRSSVNFLKMTHIPGKTNKVSQQLQNLEAGKEYMLFLLFTGFEDNTRAEYDLDIKLHNAKIVDTQRRPMSDWMKMKCYNSYRVRFLAGQAPVTLEISDPVRNVGPKTLLIDGISVTPYFSGNAVE